MYALAISLIVIIFAVVTSAEDAADTCYNPQVDFYKMMGTRTAYELVHKPDNLRPPADLKCKPLQMWVLARHGTKYPENKQLSKLRKVTEFRDQILENHENNGTGQLCAADLNNLRNWKLDANITVQTNEELAPQGEKDLENFAKRLKKAYPELFDIKTETYKPSDYTFATTNRQRTRESMRSLINGILGENYEGIGQLNGSVLHNNDTLLLPHKNCKAWDKEYKKIKDDLERVKFIQGPEINGILKEVSERLGFKKVLDYNTVKVAYDMCRYEVAWYPSKVSTWCSIFKKKDLEIFEYSEDLEFYYCCGPGRQMSKKLGCKTVADMFSHFKKIEAGEETNQPKAVFYFAHTMTIQLMLSALNIGEEAVPFTSKTYATAANRKYHVSKLGPFATNVVAVFHRCEESEPKYKVSLHVAETAAPLENCENGLCDWEFMKKEYAQIVDNCSFDFCNTDSSTKNDKVGTFREGLSTRPLLGRQA